MQGQWREKMACRRALRQQAREGCLPVGNDGPPSVHEAAARGQEERHDVLAVDLHGAAAPTWTRGGSSSCPSTPCTVTSVW